MKYIKTKDGIFEFGKEYLTTTGKTKGKQTRFGFRKLTEENFEKMKEENHWEIIKQADTIEELCDGFIEVWQSGDLLCHSQINICSKRAMNEYNKYRKETNIIYGAIWTDKGLIYVAKMNDKGTLELL